MSAVAVQARVVSYCGASGGGGGVSLPACSCSRNDFCMNSRNLGGNVERSPVMWERVDGSSKSPMATASAINLVIMSNCVYGWSLRSGWLGSGALRWLGLLMKLKHTTD